MKLEDRRWKRVLIVLSFPLWIGPAIVIVYAAFVVMLAYYLVSDYIENGWSR